MLKRIQCDEFKTFSGAIRLPIEFHKGLNAVIGNESGTNSVGKSTFLMILDFVFGGDDYIRKSKEVHKNILPHQIRFEFEFEGQSFYFYRTTDDYRAVFRCNREYKPLEDGEMTIAQYCDFLAGKYGLVSDGLTFRGAVSRFIRVDRRETMKEDKPFRSSERETDAAAILGMLKLYGRYGEVEQQEKVAAEAEDREDTFRAAQKYEYIPHVKNKTEYKRNKEKIITLQAIAENLAAKSSDGLLDLDSMQAEKLRELRAKLSSFRRQRTRLQGQLDIIKQSQADSKKTFQRDYDELLYFFPEVDAKRLEEVENFHRNLTRILGGEIKDSVVDIEAMIEIVATEIKRLEEETIRIKKMPNVAMAILDEYAAIKKELQLLIDANEAYDNRERLHTIAQDEKKKLDDLIVTEMARIDLKLDGIMEEMNSTMYEDAMKAPIINVESATSYSFYTPDDGGTGMRYKGLILFDLAVLQSSNLPFLVHDSVLLLQIENEVVERILDYYSKSEKQIFIAFDKTATEKAMEILKKAEVLHLTRGGNELFGRAWNRKDNVSEGVHTEISVRPLLPSWASARILPRMCSSAFVRGCTASSKILWNWKRTHLHSSDLS